VTCVRRDLGARLGKRRGRDLQRHLGLKLTYKQEAHTLQVSTGPVRYGLFVVSEDRLDHYAHALHLQGRLWLVS
jgi:hypothetical protein